MEIPILENRRPAGLLRVSAQGLYTLFEARLEGGGEGLGRLWLSGEGRAAPLGLLEPRGGLRLLRRRLSRLELRAFPAPIRGAFVLPADARPRPGDGAPERSESAPPGEAAWLRLPDGSLLDPERGLLALPWGGAAFPPGVRRIRVEGKDYWLFRT